MAFGGGWGPRPPPPERSTKTCWGCGVGNCFLCPLGLRCVYLLFLWPGLACCVVFVGKLGSAAAAVDHAVSSAEQRLGYSKNKVK